MDYRGGIRSAALRKDGASRGSCSSSSCPIQLLELIIGLPVDVIIPLAEPPVALAPIVSIRPGVD